MPSGDFETKGAFSDVVLPALLVRALNQRFTGMFRAERESIIKVIYFKEGDIAFASSNQPSDRLGEVLIKRGQLTREQLDMAMSKLEANVSLGRMLVELGYLSPKELLAGAKAQVEEILFSLNTWHEGTYEFVEGPLASRIVDLKLNMKQVVLQSIMQVEDRNWVLEQIGSMETVFSPSPELSDAMQSMRLDTEVNDVIGLIDGTNSVRDLCARSTLDEFTVSKTAAALFLLNLCHITAHNTGTGEYLTPFDRDEPPIEATTIVGGGGLVSDTIPGGFSATFDSEDDVTAAGLSDTAASSTAVGSSTEEVSFEHVDTTHDEDELAYEEAEDWDEDDELDEPRSKMWLIPVALLLIGGIGAGLWFTGMLPFGKSPEEPEVVRASPTAAPSTPIAKPSLVVATPVTTSTTTPDATGSLTSVATPAPSVATPAPSVVAVMANVPVATPPPVASAIPVAVTTPSSTSAIRLTPPLPGTTTASPSPKLPPVVRDTPPPVASKPMPTPPAVVAVVKSTPPVAVVKSTPPVAVVKSTPPVAVVKSTPPVAVVKSTPGASATRAPVTTQLPAPGQSPPAVGSPKPSPSRTPVSAPRSTPVPPVDAMGERGGGLSGAQATAGRASLTSGSFRSAANSFAAAAVDGYALQLEIVCQEASVRDGWKSAAGDERYYVLPLQYRGRACYRVLWGAYSSAAEASRDESSVPAFFRNQLGGRKVPTYRVKRGR